MSGCEHGMGLGDSCRLRSPEPLTREVEYGGSSRRSVTALARFARLRRSFRIAPHDPSRSGRPASILIIMRSSPNRQGRRPPSGL